MTTPHILRDRTLACQSLFSRCVSISFTNTSRLDLFESWQGQFNLWAAGLRATQYNKSSLDYRVRQRADIRELMGDLLSGLTEALESCLHTDVHAMPGSLTTTEAVSLVEANDTTATFSGFSGLSSDESTSESGGFDQKDPCVEHFFHIRTILDQLSRASTAIRRSGIKYRHEKADKSLNENDFTDFKAYLTITTLTATVQPRANEQAVDITLVGQVTDQNRLNLVQRRLIHANIVRRNRIIFATRDIKRANHPTEYDMHPRVDIPQMIENWPTNDPVPESAVAPAVPISRPTVLLPKGISVLDATSTVQSATEVGSGLHLQALIEPPKSTSPSVMTKITETGATRDYPSCPKPTIGKQLQCPFCADILSMDYSTNKSRWRGHVAQDIIPYSCIFEECSAPDELYLTSDDLNKHMLKEHGTVRWVCDFCSSKSSDIFTFATLDDWEYHMRQQHPTTFEHPQLPSLGKVSQRTVIDLSHCPLCSYKTDTITQEVDEHILKHLHDFALRCLPWNSDAALYDSARMTTDDQFSSGSAISDSDSVTGDLDFGFGNSQDVSFHLDALQDSCRLYLESSLSDAKEALVNRILSGISSFPRNVECEDTSAFPDVKTDELRSQLLHELHNEIDSVVELVENLQAASANNAINPPLTTALLSELEDAITIARNVVKATPEDHPARTERLKNLANRLGDRYSSTGAISDLEEAMNIDWEAVKAKINDYTDQAGVSKELENRLGNKYPRIGATMDLKDVEEAVSLAREAMRSVPKDSPLQAVYLNILGAQLLNRYSRTRAVGDLEEADIYFKKALHSEEATVSERLRGGRSFLLSPNILHDEHGAYIAAKTAVSLIPMLSSFPRRSADEQDQLGSVIGLASDAAAIALHTGHGPFAALELLETCHSIFARSLQDIRTDLAALQQEYPGLARDFVSLRIQLDDPDRCRQASTQMEHLLDDVRRHPGFERFLTSATEEEMREAAAYGPIIVINVSSHRCDALVVERSSVRVIFLQQLTQKGVLEHSSRLRSLETLSWLWDVAVGPILDVLGFTGPPADDIWPHVWWIATGKISQFPLHAAGHHAKRSAETALDRVVSSYSSSIQSILHTRRRQYPDVKSASDSSVVLIDLQMISAQSTQIGVTEEMVEVRKACESIGMPCQQPLGCKKDVLATYEKCRILHIAGHAKAHPDPLQSLLLLPDWVDDPLTVENLLETTLSISDPFLLYSSPYSTTYSTDEILHLMNAFQSAGFRHVIGRHWGFKDESCIEVAKLMYGFLGANGVRDESVGRGLHFAIKRLRDRWAERQPGTGTTEKSQLNSQQDWPTWVAYVHFGV
ncbi:TPR domain-containing protein [Diaporthe amygdali]|uniref:TPR domain-containing protein n=1 Tax=Phomopsis amygdali TaxID=1214568 RepID=UPI0022FE6CBD|nr:TPR domain-containing protein [Diaporthe amygdali]KAJ0125421.1 TPR domain-containing protein [Diaporthe amygdali]